jgi:hypothetical protein
VHYLPEAEDSMLTVIDCDQPPPPNGEAPQMISLSAELGLLEDALSAASAIMNLLATKALPNDEAVAQAPISTNALLLLVTARLKHIRRVLNCEVDPNEILAAHNAIAEPTASDDPDVRLRPWTAAQRATHLARLLAKAETEAKHKGPTPPSP